MPPSHYHNPPPPASPRARCPVCHEAVYSPAGIHPQCAVRQADPPRPKPKPPAPPGQADGAARAHEQAGVVAIPPDTVGRPAPD